MSEIAEFVQRCVFLAAERADIAAVIADNRIYEASPQLSPERRSRLEALRAEWELEDQVFAEQQFHLANLMHCSRILTINFN